MTPRRSLALVCLLALLLPALAWATVTSTTARNTYTGNGLTTVYPYTFRILLNTDIAVTVGGALQTLTTNYTVSNVGAAGGGNITFTVAPASGAAIVFLRSVPKTQLTDYVENAPFSAETLERNLDKLTMIAQTLAEQLARAPQLPVTQAGPVALAVPVVGQFLYWATANSLDSSALPLPVLGAGGNVDIPGTSLPYGGTNKFGLRWEVAIGTSASPITSLGPAFKVSQTSNLTAPFTGCTYGVAPGEIDPLCGAAMAVIHNAKSTSKMMNTALSAYADGDHGAALGEGDNVAGFFTSHKSAGTGVSTGLYAEGRRLGVGSGAGIYAVGAEIRTANLADADCEPFTSNALQCASVLLTTNTYQYAPGSYRLGGGGAAAYSVNGVANMQYGYACLDPSVGTFNGGCFVDRSTGQIAFMVAGAHQYGLDATNATISGAAINLSAGQKATWTDGANTTSLSGQSPNQIRFEASSASGVQLHIVGSGATPSKYIDANGTNFRILAHDAATILFNLTNAGAPSFKAGGIPTGAAGGGKVVCVAADGTLHASSTGTDCTN